MTLAECASYLHLSEKTVLKLAQDSELPGAVSGRKWAFQRADVDAWLEKQQGIEEKPLEELRDGMQVPLEELMPVEAIIEDLGSQTAITVIEELAARAWSHQWLSDKPWFIGALVEREALASTAMEGGVAFLHTRSRESDRVARPFIVMGRSYNGIDFGAPDGKPTFLFFLLGLQYDKLHLPILGRLARLMRSATTVAKLRSLPSPTKIRALLLRKDAEARGTKEARPADKAAEERKPTLDRQMRLRAIMRLDAQRKHQAKKAEEAKKGTKKKASKKASAKKTVAKKAPAKKAATKASATKASATKASATKASATKASATKASATKASATKASATKASATKASATKASAAKAPATKAPATKAASKKSE
ncbi:PTS sugar transporter subunit IIA [Haliangium ochraceum]|nr:PTS sugar transporter subunit IIA [Haliangium ochraceum]